MNKPSVMKSAMCVAGLMWVATAYAQSAPMQAWTLASVLDRVSQANRDVLSAHRAVSAARADQLTASVTPAAQFSLLSQSIDMQHLGGGSLWQRQIDTIARIDKTLERGGKASLRERSASVALAAARFDEADVLRVQRLTAAQAYWDLKLAQEQFEIGQHNVQLAKESSDAAQLRLKQGDLSRLDATRLAVEADKAANEEAQDRSQLMQARLTLAQALAMEGATLPKAVDAWPDVVTLPVGGELDDAWLQSRPEVLAAQRRLEQAQADLALAQSQRTADVTVSVQFEHNPPAGNRLWGVGVAFPIGVDGRQDGPVTRALIAVDEAQAQVEKVRAAAQADHALQREALSTALDRVRRLEGQLLPQAREALKGAEFARQQGALGLQDVLDARRALHAAELDAATAHADAAKAWVALTMTSDLNAVTP